jgi:Na+-driven multidrug efflux pump
MSAANSKLNMDMLNGPLGRKILRFAIPIALSSIFQQMFNLADVAVVGQFAGDKALAAVGANTFVINMLINLFVGISVGANVVVANSIGERSYRSVTRSVHTSVMVAFFSGILLSFVGVFFARPILELISTPADVLDMAVRYLQIYFVGMPFVMVYNFIAAILRSKGDTKRPLYVLMVAGAVNVVLNVILVAVFGLGVSGVAILIMIIVGGNLFGAIGILLAIPCTAIFAFMYDEVILPWIRNRRLQYEGQESGAEHSGREEVQETSGEDAANTEQHVRHSVLDEAVHEEKPAL